MPLVRVVLRYLLLPIGLAIAVILVVFGGYPWPLLVYAVGALLLSLYALRPNIQRLRNGTETQVPPIRIFKRASHG